MGYSRDCGRDEGRRKENMEIFFRVTARSFWVIKQNEVVGELTTHRGFFLGFNSVYSTNFRDLGCVLDSSSLGI